METPTESPLTQNGDADSSSFDDADLVQASVNGNGAAFTELLQRHRQKVVGLVRKKMGDYHDCEDVVQEVRIVAWRKIGTIKRKASFSSWIGGVTKRVCQHSCRKKVRSKETTVPEPDARVADVSPTDDGDENLLEVVKSGASEKVSDAFREIIPGKNAQYVQTYTWKHQRNASELVPPDISNKRAYEKWQNSLHTKSLDDAARECCLAEYGADFTRDQSDAMKHRISVALDRTRQNNESLPFGQAHHRRAFLQKLILSSGLALVQDAELRAEERVVQYQARVRELLTRYSYCCRLDERIGVEVIDEFLQLGIEKGPDGRFLIEDSALWLQPLAGSNLWEKAVGRVVSGEWRAADLHPSDSIFFSRDCRRFQARLYRQQRRVPDAISQLTELQNEWSQSARTEREFQELATVLWELGYANFQRAGMDHAKEFFKQSDRFASDAADRVAVIIAQFNLMWCDYHARRLPPDTAKRIAERYREQLRDYARLDERAKQWLSNIDGRLFLLALDEKNGALAVKIYDSFRKNEAHKRSEEDPRIRLWQHIHQGRLAVVMGEHRQALEHFSRFLRLPVSKFGDPQPDQVGLVTDHSEIALAFRDAGIALDKLGMRSCAAEVWRAGLDLPDDTGNSFVKQRDLRQLLRGNRV